MVNLTEARKEAHLVNELDLLFSFDKIFGKIIKEYTKSDVYYFDTDDYSRDDCSDAIEYAEECIESFRDCRERFQETMEGIEGVISDKYDTYDDLNGIINTDKWDRYGASFDSWNDTFEIVEEIIEALKYYVKNNKEQTLEISVFEKFLDDATDRIPKTYFLDIPKSIRDAGLSLDYVMSIERILKALCPEALDTNDFKVGVDLWNLVYLVKPTVQ